MTKRGPRIFTFVVLARPSSDVKRAARRKATHRSRAKAQLPITRPSMVPNQSVGGTGAQAASRGAAFPGTTAVRPASPNSRYVLPAKPPVGAACFVSETRTAHDMWRSCHGRLTSHPRADTTLAARSPLLHTRPGHRPSEEMRQALRRGGRHAMFSAFPQY